ncbi:MAG: hypothetical protein KGL16_09095, partial [Acidobacteriota bacterium]|nr:hypothetical protein [Acidobacteriota bacterium]
MRLVAAPCLQDHGRVDERLDSDRLGDQPRLLEHQPCLRELPGQHLAAGQEAERELQVRERAAVARCLDLPRRQAMQGRVVPQLERHDVGVAQAREREPRAHLEGRVIAADEQRERAREARHGLLV